MNTYKHLMRTWLFLCLVVILPASGAVAAAALPVMTPQTDCNGYPCLESYEELAAWNPANADPRAAATVPLAPRANISQPGLLMGLDFTSWDYKPEADGATQGGSVGNLYAFSHWQYVDTAYYYRHSLILVPPVVWTNAAHRNGVRMLGTVTSDCGTCRNGFEALFAPAHVAVTTAQLTALARTYGFDGWLIDIEFSATAETIDGMAAVISALRGHGLYVLFYQAYTQSLSLDDPTPFRLANAANAWQSDYGLSGDDPPTTYRALQGQPLSRWNAYSAANLYAAEGGDPPCPAGQLSNGIKCLVIESFWNYLRTVVTAAAPGGAWTSLAVYAPAWPAYGGLSGQWASVPAPAIWRAVDDAIWEGPAVRGPACVQTQSGSFASWVRPRTAVTALPFTSDFNRGFGPRYTLEGQPVALRGWNHLGSQAILPTWLCQTLGDASEVTLRYADGLAWNGSTALSLSGTLSAQSSAEWALWSADLPLTDSPVARLRFLSDNALAPYLRLIYADGGDTIIPGAKDVLGWNTTQTLVTDAARRTVTRIAVGVRNETDASLPVQITLGEVALADARDLVPLQPIVLPPASAVITWTAPITTPLHTNVWALDAGQQCLRYLGPAFTHSYDTARPLFPLPVGVEVENYVAQPVNAAGVPAPLSQPLCLALARFRSYLPLILVRH